MRFHRIVALFAATAAAVLVMPGIAHAEPYPAGPPASSVSDGVVSDGGTVVFSGKGFDPYEDIRISVSYGSSDSAAADRTGAGGFYPAAMELARRVTLSTTATAAGTFSISVPLSRVGTATLRATGLSSGVTVAESVKVLAEDSSEEPDDSDDSNDAGDADDTAALPRTGPGGTPMLIALVAGTGAVLLGTALLLLVRGRRRSL